MQDLAVENNVQIMLEVKDGPDGAFEEYLQDEFVVRARAIRPGASADAADGTVMAFRALFGPSITYKV